MKRFLLKVTLFFALMAVIDVTSGYGFKYLCSHAKSGDTRKYYDIAENCEADILILGSSRAVRHYDPEIIEKKFGLSCYNCGEPGCGVLTAYARYKLITSRHKPKLVLYEITPSYDYYDTDDYSKYLGSLRQYADKKETRDMFVYFGDELESLRLLSNLYKNNSFIVHNIIDNIVVAKDHKGYAPLQGVMNHNKRKHQYKKNEKRIDRLKLSYIEKLIAELKLEGVTICFIASPKYIDAEYAQYEEPNYEPIKSLCKKYGVRFINHSYFDKISDNYSFFHDFEHLNDKGAKVYTLEICEELNDQLDIN